MSVNFLNNIPDYKENQEKLLCAKHALNNIFQEEKIVWDPVKLTYVSKKTGKSTESDDNQIIFNKNIQLNLFRFCNSYPERLARESRQNLSNLYTNPNPDDFCDMKNGMLPFEALQFILKDLGFRVEFEYNLANIDKLKKPNAVGAIINLGKGHYTALSKFLKQCKSWTRNETRRLTSVSYSYMDSIPKASVTCLSNNTLTPFLSRLPVSAIIYVYFNPGSYGSVSVQRARAFNLKVGGKQKTRTDIEMIKKSVRKTRKSGGAPFSNRTRVNSIIINSPKDNNIPSPEELEECLKAFKKVQMDHIEHDFYASTNSKLLKPEDYRIFVQKQRLIIESLSRDECNFLKILCQKVYNKQFGYMESYYEKDLNEVGIVYFDDKKRIVVGKKTDVSARYADLYRNRGSFI